MKKTKTKGGFVPKIKRVELTSYKLLVHFDRID